MSFIQDMQKLRTTAIDEEYEAAKTHLTRLIKQDPKKNAYKLIYAHQDQIYSNINLLIKNRFIQEGFVVIDLVGQPVNEAGFTIFVPMNGNSALVDPRSNQVDSKSFRTNPSCQ